MFLYGYQYVQLVGMRSDGADNTVGSMVLVIQLSTWTCRSPVPAVHPHEVTGSEGQYMSPVGVYCRRMIPSVTNARPEVASVLS